MKTIRILSAVTSAICVAALLLLAGAYNFWQQVAFWIVFVLFVALHLAPLFYSFTAKCKRSVTEGDDKNKSKKNKKKQQKPDRNPFELRGPDGNE